MIKNIPTIGKATYKTLWNLCHLKFDIIPY